MTDCFIGLGSNLANAGIHPMQQLIIASNAIDISPGCQVVNCSSIYQSKALTLDSEPQADYFNAVIQIETHLEAQALLDVLQTIETAQGRTREKRWAARTIDLDILLYGNQVIQTSRLIVPHPEMFNRDFVLLPLYQIAPDIGIADSSGNKILKDVITKLSESSIKRVGEFNAGENDG